MTLMPYLSSLLVICAGFADSSADEYSAFEEHLATGVSAYWEEEWQYAIDEIQLALKNYRYYEDGIHKCYMQCKNSSDIDWDKKLSDWTYIIYKASCSRSCLDEKFGDSRSLIQISEETKYSFDMYRPYMYLQFAYFQVGNIEMAVKCAYTYWLRHIGDEEIEDSMEYYKGLEEMEDNFVDLAAEPHMVAYTKAVEYYTEENYSDAITSFKDALELYYQASDKCNALCEGEHIFDYDYPDVPSFDMQTADHYIQVTECSLECIHKLSTDEALYKFPNFLPLNYHYLQFALYQQGEINESLSCAKTYLIFHPEDAVMIENVQLISNKTKTNVETLQKAVEYKKKIDIQIALLRYSYRAFGYEYKTHLLNPFLSQEEEELFKNPVKPKIQEVAPEDTFYQSFQEKQADIIEKKSRENEILEELSKEKEQQQQEDKKKLSNNKKLPAKLLLSDDMVTIGDAASDVPVSEGVMLTDETVLVANSTQLKGPTRFLVDRLISENECEDLINLELSFGTEGDGYNGKKQPHTKFEKFEGLSIYETATLADKGEIPYRIARLYYDISEKVRAQVQAYFKLPALYFDYTHLVCRTALSSSDEDREDLSHPVHADNCLLKEGGECLKKKPAYIWRDYSAILYLNENFEGGNFMFLDTDAKHIVAEVEPRCGRMAAFCAGKECFHGVRPLTKGQRCAVAMWFTMNVNNDEVARKEAKQILDNIESRKQEL